MYFALRFNLLVMSLNIFSIGSFPVDDIFDSGYFVVYDIFKLSTGQEYAPVTILKISILRVAHLCDVVKKFFSCHVLLLLVLLPLPHTDLRTLGGVYVRFPLPPCHRRPRLSSCFRSTP